MLPDPAVPSFPSFPSFPSNERSERDMATIRCDIVSAEQEIFHGEAEMIVPTGEMGELGIAPRHAPLLTRPKDRKSTRLNPSHHGPTRMPPSGGHKKHATGTADHTSCEAHTAS